MKVNECDWEWFGVAGHLIVGHMCRFHLCTKVGNYLVSTVGEYWPSRASREIHADIHDPQWLRENKHLLGDHFDAAYMKRFGFESIGAGDDKYETMVFRITGEKRCDSAECSCGLPSDIDWSELEARRYRRAGEATRGHLEACQKWAVVENVCA